jgi:hypothetical protein
MRSVRLLSLLFFLVLHPLAWAQQSQVVTPPPTATKDPQAIDVVTQTLGTAGGNAAIKAIVDYTANGNVTNYLDVDRELKGTVTVRGRGSNQFRLDSSLSSGVRSEVTDGTTTVKAEDGTVSHPHTQPPMAPARLVVPYLQLIAALTSRTLNLTDKGIVNVDGSPLHDIQVQHISAASPNRIIGLTAPLTVDYFIDPSTFQITMIQDTVFTQVTRQLRYSNFKTVNGISIPFSISATIYGRVNWIIDLSAIEFNVGLQDSDFQL